jgi:hypothetical protein
MVTCPDDAVRFPIWVGPHDGAVLIKAVEPAPAVTEISVPAVILTPEFPAIIPTLPSARIVTFPPVEFIPIFPGACRLSVEGLTIATVVSCVPWIGPSTNREALGS